MNDSNAFGVEKPIDHSFTRELLVHTSEQESHSLSILQQWFGDVGVVVWDSALLFTKFLEFRSQRSPQWLRGKVVLELGAGTGVCGLVASLLGCNVVITDLPKLLPLINANIERNKPVIQSCGGGEVVGRFWEWARFDTFDDIFVNTNLDGKSLDFVFISDCVYYEEGMKSLYTTIKWLCCCYEPNLQIYLSYEEREEHVKLTENFFKLLSSTSTLQWSEISHEEHHPSYTSPDLHLILIEPKRRV